MKPTPHDRSVVIHHKCREPVLVVSLADAVEKFGEQPEHVRDVFMSSDGHGVWFVPPVHDPDKHKDYFTKTRDGLLVELWYPRLLEERKYVEVGLCDVRAADSIRIEYDFERDGWAISQMRWAPENSDAEDGPWVEVAFLRAWALQEEEPTP